MKSTIQTWRTRNVYWNNTYVCFFFSSQDQDEAEQEGESMLKEQYTEAGRQSSRSSEASEVEEEDEDEGNGQRIPISVSK